MFYALTNPSGQLSFSTQAYSEKHVPIDDDISNSHLYYLEDNKIKRSKEVSYTIDVRDGIPYITFSEPQVMIEIMIPNGYGFKTMECLCGSAPESALGVSIEINQDISISSLSKEFYFEPIILQSEGLENESVQPNIYILNNVLYIKHSGAHNEIKTLREEINFLKELNGIN